MARPFEDLGLRDELLAAVEALDYPGPTELQASAIPILRRGNNALLHASAGAGVTATWGLALLDRLAGEAPQAPGVRLLALVPTQEAAGRQAASLAAPALAAGLRVTALAASWAPPDSETEVVIATPRAALEAVRASSLKLDAIQALVLDAADALLAADDEAVETLVGSVPAGAQRVLVAGEPEAVRDFADRHVRRALQLPKPDGEPGGGEAPVGFLAATEAARTEALGRILAGAAGGGFVVFCRTDERAAGLAEELVIRGFDVGEDRDSGERLRVEVAAASAEEGPRRGRTPVSFDVPADPGTLRRRHAAGGVVLLEPREIPHLERIASRAGLVLVALPEPRPERLELELHAYRERLRAAAASQDLGAQLLLLEPLLEELGAPVVAAAASALLRERPATAPAARSEQPPATGAPAPPVTGWTRLFVSLGQRDGVRPADIVGAITGEARIPGDRVGKIEIRDTFSRVEVANQDAEAVIRALNGVTVRGRAVRVDFDRERGGGPRRPGGAGPRRGPGGPSGPRRRPRPDDRRAGPDERRRGPRDGET